MSSVTGIRGGILARDHRNFGSKKIRDDLKDLKSSILNTSIFNRQTECQKIERLLRFWEEKHVWIKNKQSIFLYIMLADDRENPEMDLEK